jgi:hypothetical protein
MKIFRVEPVLLGSVAAAVYAAAAMLYRAYVAKDASVLDWDLLVAAGTAVWGLYTRLKVTPLAAPKNAHRVRLVPVDQTPRHGVGM